MISSSFVSSAQVLLPIKKDGKYGYINEKGEVVIQPKYEFANQFYDGLASVKIEGKKGFIDKGGKN